MGIDVNRTIALTFVLAGALAGAAGMVVGAVQRIGRWFYGHAYCWRAFTAAVLGGIGNLMGAVIGGIGLGSSARPISLSASTSSSAAGDLRLGILVIILVFRPTGLLAENVGQKA